MTGAWNFAIVKNCQVVVGHMHSLASLKYLVWLIGLRIQWAFPIMDDKSLLSFCGHFLNGDNIHPLYQPNPAIFTHPSHTQYNLLGSYTSLLPSVHTTSYHPHPLDPSPSPLCLHLITMTVDVQMIIDNRGFSKCSLSAWQKDLNVEVILTSESMSSTIRITLTFKSFYQADRISFWKNSILFMFCQWVKDAWSYFFLKLHKCWPSCHDELRYNSRYETRIWLECMAFLPLNKPKESLMK